MIPLLIFLGVVVVVVLIVGGMIVGIYNKLVTMRNRYKNAYAQIDVQLKRRYDLIPNLVETAKGYMAHERGTLEAVTAADRKSTRLNSSHANISYAVFCLTKNNDRLGDDRQGITTPSVLRETLHNLEK